MKFNSIRFKISILYTAILGLILAVYTSFIYLNLYYNLYRDFDERLEMKANAVTNTVASYLNILGHDHWSFIFSFKRAIGDAAVHGDQDKMARLETLWLKNIESLGLKDDYIIFTNPSGEVVVSSGNMQLELVSLLSKSSNIITENQKMFTNVRYKGSDLRMVSMPFSLNNKTVYILKICTPLEPLQHIITIMLYYRWISVPVILVLGFFIGGILTTRILKPVVRITETARKITYEDLRERVKAGHVDEEIKPLVEAFNDMISRLEKSFKYVSEFSSHAAHELKTPLAIIRGQTEVVLRKERSLDEYKAVLHVNLEEAQRMIRMIEDLLLLTRLEYNTGVFHFEQIDLLEFLREIYEQSKVLALEKELVVSSDIPGKPIMVKADKLHLRRLFFNLINNAVKFTPAKGKIDITVKAVNNKVAVSVSDTGMGIAEEDLPKIFNKFFQKDMKIKSSNSGIGLGLNIVQSIAKIHNADVQVKSKPGRGTTFTVILPIT
ncbi:MAG: ATP-binding protein [Candidatus Omnitrophota bacterium]|jgi:heavy metal sensor kinase